MPVQEPLFKALAELRAIQEPVQEPVAWWKRYPNGSVELNEARTFIAEDAIATGRRPLVFGDAAAPQAKPLTDEQIDDIAGGRVDYFDRRVFARAIEAAHGIKP